MTDIKLLTRIAELYYIHDADMSVIADKFNFSISKVSRMLKMAREEKIIEFQIKYFEDDNFTLQKSLEDAFGIKEAIIYSDLKIAKHDPEIIFQEIGKLGSRYLERVLKNNINIFVCGGKTIYSAFKKIKVSKKITANIYATLGGLNLRLEEYESNRLVQQLSEKIGGTFYPVYLPLILKNANYKEILKDEYVLNNIDFDSSKNDVYISGISAISTKSRLYTLGSFELDFLNSLKAKNIIGEVGLNFYDIDGEFIQTEFDDRIVKLNVDKILKIKNRVIMAFGKDKILSLKGILKTGLPTILVTDELTALELLKND